jgi:hypothetical protein
LLDIALLCFFEIVYFSKANRYFRDFWLLFTVASTAAVFPLHAEENKKSSTDFVASLFEKTTTTFTVKPSNKPIVVDATQPMLVRKASIACIGKFGVPSDTEILQQLATENFRIAQAAKPALEAITDRESNNSPQVMPF